MTDRFNTAIEDCLKEEEQLYKGLFLAMRAHAEQSYGDLPYLSHLLEVDQNVVKLFKPTGMKHSEPFSKEPGDEIDKLRAIAYLHDTLEDTDLTVEHMRLAGIDEDVIHAVQCLSKHDGQEYMVYMDVVLSNELARKVKLCDTMANLNNSLREGNMKRIRKYSKQITILEEGF